jgi:fructose-specific phosphotransferase system IIC component
MFYYLLPFFVVFCIFVVVGFMIIRINKERKSTASYSLLCGVLLGMSVLISRKVNEIMVENMSANMHFLVIALLTLLVNGFTTSVMFFDVIRYYYFTKLEKMGLVTEDILKPDK